LLQDLKVNKKMIKYWDYLREYRKLKREILNSVNKVFESGTLLFGEELKKLNLKETHQLLNDKSISFDGIDGRFSFEKNIISRKLNVLKISNGKANLVK